MKRHKTYKHKTKKKKTAAVYVLRACVKMKTEEKKVSENSKHDTKLESI